MQKKTKMASSVWQPKEQIQFPELKNKEPPLVLGWPQLFFRTATCAFPIKCYNAWTKPNDTAKQSNALHENIARGRYRKRQTETENVSGLNRNFFPLTFFVVVLSFFSGEFFGTDFPLFPTTSLETAFHPSLSLFSQTVAYSLCWILQTCILTSPGRPFLFVAGVDCIFIGSWQESLLTNLPFSGHCKQNRTQRKWSLSGYFRKVKASIGVWACIRSHCPSVHGDVNSLTSFGCASQRFSL